MENILSSIKNKSKSLAIGLAFSLKKTEDDILKQTSHSLNMNSENGETKVTNTLMSALLRGEVTKEVAAFRYRNYKIYNATSDKIRKNAKNNFFISKIDNNNVDFVIENEKFEEASYEKEFPKDILEYIKTKENPSRTLKIEYNEIPKFFLENKCDYAVIKSTSNNNIKNIELYIPIYRGFNDPSHNLIMSYLRSCTENKILNPSFQIRSLMFLTMGVVGVKNFLKYEYNDFKLIDIIEDGIDIGKNKYFILRYEATCIVDGENTLKDLFDADVELAYNKPTENKSNDYIVTDFSKPEGIRQGALTQLEIDELNKKSLSEFKKSLENDMKI